MDQGGYYKQLPFKTVYGMPDTQPQVPEMGESGGFRDHLQSLWLLWASQVVLVVRGAWQATVHGITKSQA